MGKLTVVPTPVGNLQDITLRALEVLKQADLILAEDTRVTRKLLQHFQIDRPVRSYHQHNEHRLVDSLVNELQGDVTYALVSDAGTPSISDPGFLLVRACLQAGDILVECLPGATAFVPALVNSGLPSDTFVFTGFLPHKKGRQTKLTELAADPRTTILYESPHRLVKTLSQLIEYCGAERRVSVSRELTKLYEETVRGTLSEVHTHYEQHPPKGEIVIVVAGYAN